jgi:glycosyltransferase involved in cell wall biosynthesis
MDEHHIGISLGNLTNFVGGLGEVAERLGKTLALQAAELRAQHGLLLHFHTTAALQGCFGNGVNYLPVARHQEWRHTASQRMDVWHVLNQLNRYPPPQPGARCIATVWDLNYLYEKQGLSRRLHQWRMRRLLARMHGVVTTTQHVAGDIRRELHWSGPLHVIHSGVRDQSGVAQTPVPGLPERFFFHISRMTPSKNVEALLALMAVWPDRHLVLAGPSAERNQELQGAAARQGLRNVTVLTRITAGQKAWLYAHCEAFFFPSITEGFGLPPIEAMHFGKPAFLSDRTSLPEVGGSAAFYWPEFEPLAMRHVVEEDLRRHDTAHAETVRRHARQFNWDDAAAAYVCVYLAMLNECGPGPAIPSAA